MIQAYSVALLAFLGIGAVLCLRSPFAGLLFLIAVTPFYTILREASTGSPIFFLWPYLLTALLMVAMTFSEGGAALARRGVKRAQAKLIAGTAAAVGVMLLLAELRSGLVSTMFADRSLTAIGNATDDAAFAVLVAAAALFLGIFFVIFFMTMRRREGRTSPLDVVVAAFLAYGVLQVLNTWIQTGVLFTGLNALRYYFIAAAVYFPARYLLQQDEHRRRFLTVLLAASVVGAAQMLVESYLLNVRGVAPDAMPWVGRLASEFNFGPTNDRSYFDGYRPIGFMYMSHMSGMFLLLGLALAVPTALVARSWKQLAPYLLILAVLVTGAVWTSRTVLALIVMASAAGIFLVPASWARRISALTALVAFMFLASRYLIPGARYDLPAEISMMVTRTVPALVEAILVDVQQIATGKPRERRPTGWRLISRSGSVAVDREHVRSGVTSLRIGGEDGAAYRNFIPISAAMHGREVKAEAWVKAYPSSFVTVVLESGALVAKSAGHRARGEWELMTTSLRVQPETTTLALEIDVAKGTVFVDRVTLHVENGEGNTLAMNLHTPDVAPPAPEPVPAATAVVAQRPTRPTEPAPPRREPERAIEPQAPAAPPSGARVSDLSALLDIPEASSSTAPQHPPTIRSVLFGRGAQFTGWNRVLLADAPAGAFAAASYSDTKYLEFAEQFGLVGLLLLLGIAALGLWGGWQLIRREDNLSRRVEFVALTLIVTIAFVSMLHLPSLFRVGFNTAVFVALSLIAGGGPLWRRRTPASSGESLG